MRIVAQLLDMLFLWGGRLPLLLLLRLPLLLLLPRTAAQDGCASAWIFSYQAMTACQMQTAELSKGHARSFPAG